MNRRAPVWWADCVGCGRPHPADRDPDDPTVCTDCGRSRRSGSTYRLVDKARKQHKLDVARRRGLRPSNRPLTSRRLGGNEGPVPFLSEETSRPQAVHLNPAGYPELDMSGAVLVVAEFEADTSMFLKRQGPASNSRPGRDLTTRGGVGS